MRFITGLICLGISFLLSFGLPSGKCVAFFYADKPIPDDILYAYDWIVVSRQNRHLEILKEKFYMKKRGKLIAYLSIGERREDELTPELEKDVLGENPNWRTKVMDIRKKNYRNYLIKKVENLLSQFDGVFFDTLDSYKLVLNKEDWKSYEDALADFLNTVSTEHPDKIILLNRGFEVIKKVKNVDGIVVESLFKERNQAVVENIINLLKKLREKGLEVVLVEYEKEPKRIKKLIEKTLSLGFSIYISPDRNLQSFGYSQCKIVPRKVILLYDSSIFLEPQSADIHRLVQLPLEYLGFIPVLIDVNGKLPKISRQAGYVGVISMNISRKSGKLDNWLKEVKLKGIKLFFIKELPFSDTNEEILKSFGIKKISLPKLRFITAGLL